LDAANVDLVLCILHEIARLRNRELLLATFLPGSGDGTDGGDMSIAAGTRTGGSGHQQSL
jgi:hypothetical protein